MKKPVGYYYQNYLNKAIKAILYIILLISFIYSNITPSKILVDRGISHLYNYQFQASKFALDSALQIDPLHPVPPFLLIVTDWLNQQTQFGYEESYKAIQEGVKKTIPIYKSLIKKHPDNAEYVLFLGCTYGIKARIGLAVKDWFDVLYSGYKGVSLVKRAYKMDPELYDALMPIGLMDYYSCISSTPIQWISRIMGINPDCDVGIEKLEHAVKKSKYAWIESSNVLTYIYLYFEKDYKKSLQTVLPLVKKFPDHPYFQFLKAETLGRLGRWEEVSEMRSVLEQFTVTGSFLQKNECELKLKNLDALYHYQKQDHQKVIEISTWMINNYHMEFDWLLGFAHIIRGKSYDLLGHRKMALADYKIVISLDNNFPEIEEANQLLKTRHIINDE